jgi:hypothetical protein
LSSLTNYISDLLPDLDEGLESDSLREKYRHDPVLWAKDFLGLQFWAKQRETMDSVCENRRTLVIAAHGTGKTFSAGVIAAWWIDTHPINEVFVASTAPSMDQVALLWDNIRDVFTIADARHAEYKRRLAAGLDLGEYAANDHPLPGKITGDQKWKLPNGRMIGQGRRPPDNKADVAFQGRHATYLLAIGDESVGINKDFLDALGNIATGMHNRQLLLCNPTDPNSETAQIWNRDDGTWNKIQVSLFDSPMIKPEPGFDITKAEGLSGQQFIDDRLADWGEDDPRYISRVLGQWAFDAGNTVFTEFELAQAKNTVVLPDPEARPQQGWDIARMGADATIGLQAIEGEVWETNPETGKPVKGTGRRGLHVRKVDRWTKAPLVGNNPENLGSAQRIHNHAVGCGARIVCIDASGMGSSVVDGLRDIEYEQGYLQYTIFEAFGGAAPSDKRAFVNARAEQYFELKRRCFAGEIDLDPAAETLFEELRGILYEYNDVGARKIESKDSMKRRGAKSPDEADALWYCAMDVSAMVDGPFAGKQPGDIVTLDDFGLWQTDRRGRPM